VIKFFNFSRGFFASAIALEAELWASLPEPLRHRLFLSSAVDVVSGFTWKIAFIVAPSKAICKSRAWDHRDGSSVNYEPSWNFFHCNYDNDETWSIASRTCGSVTAKLFKAPKRGSTWRDKTEANWYQKLDTVPGRKSPRRSFPLMFMSVNITVSMWELYEHHRWKQIPEVKHEMEHPPIYSLWLFLRHFFPSQNEFSNDDHKKAFYG
jgi:hypothetical protein